MESRKHNKVTLKIPRPLYEKITRLIEGSGYNSVTDFVVYVLRDIVGARGMPDETAYSEEELKHVKEHLRKLGYL